MESGAGFFILLGVGYIGWLMWSKKADKEIALFYSFLAMIAAGLVHQGYLLIR